MWHPCFVCFCHRTQTRPARRHGCDISWKPKSTCICLVLLSIHNWIQNPVAFKESHEVRSSVSCSHFFTAVLRSKQQLIPIQVLVLVPDVSQPAGVHRHPLGNETSFPETYPLCICSYDLWCCVASVPKMCIRCLQYYTWCHEKTIPILFHARSRKLTVTMQNMTT